MRTAFSLLSLAFALLAASLHAADFVSRPQAGAPETVKPIDALRQPQDPGLAAALTVPELGAVAPQSPVPVELPAAGNAPVFSPSPEAGTKAPEDPAAQQRRLDLTFDRRAPAKESSLDAVSAERSTFDSPRVRLMREVRTLSAPWRTQTQLDKLAQSARPAAETFRFTVIGDAEPGRFAIFRFLFNVPGVFSRLLADSARQAADFTVQLGDMVSRGTLRNFLGFFKTLAGVNPEKPYLTVIGNHDRRQPHGISDNRLYRSLFGKTDYFFEHGGVRFVTVDSSAGRLTPDQLRWLDDALATDLKKIVFTHMAPSVIKPWGKDGGDKTWGGFKDGSQEFADLVSRRGVSRVYVGHIHGLRVKEYQGVRYVITGGGGSPLFPGGVRNNFHHYLTVEVTPDGIRETVHRADGTSFSVP